MSQSERDARPLPVGKSCIGPSRPLLEIDFYLKLSIFRDIIVLYGFGNDVGDAWVEGVGDDVIAGKV